MTVETPLESCTQEMVQEKSIAIVPILRAGLGMVNGVHSIFPNARVGHIGMYRDEETATPHEYYCKLPDGIENMTTILLDPMLATGGSACDAVDLLKRRGVKRIKFMAIIGCPEGIKRLTETHPDIDVFVSTCDRTLNDKCYILPVWATRRQALRNEMTTAVRPDMRAAAADNCRRSFRAQRSAALPPCAAKLQKSCAIRLTYRSLFIKIYLLYH